MALNKFWGDHQRFFRQVICAFKVPSVIAETEAALSEGKSVVISLVGTGEARTKEQVAKATANGGMLELCSVSGYVAFSPQLLRMKRWSNVGAT